jgi:SAM-dependent methyltransferase
MQQILSEQQINSAEKPADWLPSGEDKPDYVQVDKQWPNLEKRLGKPRILDNIYFQKVMQWVDEKYKNNPEDFSYFEAGCGHGNDLRAIKKAITNKLGEGGKFLGVDMSGKEIMDGRAHYADQENPEEAKRLFAQGDLRDLKHINAWDDENEDFSKPTEIKDNEFDVVYFEAILHGLGYGQKTYEEKKASAQKMLDELFRICKIDGQFFGRASVFDGSTSKEEQLKLMRQTDNWRFIPEADELEEMLKQAGFKDIEITRQPHEKREKDINKKNIERFSFLAKK